jgi:hypothetical protein
LPLGIFIKLAKNKHCVALHFLFFANATQFIADAVQQMQVRSRGGFVFHRWVWSALTKVFSGLHFFLFDFLRAKKSNPEKTSHSWAQVRGGGVAGEGASGPGRPQVFFLSIERKSCRGKVEALR